MVTRRPLATRAAPAGVNLVNLANLVCRRGLPRMLGRANFSDLVDEAARFKIGRHGLVV